MTETRSEPSPPKRALAPEVDSLDERSRRAWTEPMAVSPLGDGRYSVESATGSTYIVDLHDGTCSCPDNAIRGELCKHQRRVAIEITQGYLPSPDEPVQCRVCGRTEEVEVVDESLAICEECRLEPGDLVIDREGSPTTPMLVLSVTGGRADEVEIKAADCTVFEYGANSKYSPADPVVEVIYPRSVSFDRPPRRYSFPISRLKKPSDRDDPMSRPSDSEDLTRYQRPQ